VKIEGFFKGWTKPGPVPSLVIRLVDRGMYPDYASIKLQIRFML